MNWLEYELSLNNKPSIVKPVYIGIDFGTSTSVVSRAYINGKKVDIEPLKLNQPEQYGGVSRHYLANSVLAWKDKKLLWGQDAYRLKPLLTEGVNVFSSFKMKLGLAIGPTYPQTQLSQNRATTDVKIETAEDATEVFFKHLINTVKQETQINNLSQYRFAFSVPASFEANQRRSLLTALETNGISEKQCCLIDEPNAAFLSFLYQATKNDEQTPIIDKLKNQECNILVYDFGAGTCDISILQVSMKERIKSRNLAISKFTALGGDDIDLAIAKKVLVDQLLGDKKYDIEGRDIDEILVPKLKATAENLKIDVNKWLAQKGFRELEQIYNYADIGFETLSIKEVKLRKDKSFDLEKPKLYLHDFAKIMEEFVGEYHEAYSKHHIIAPIYDALQKAELIADDLDAVLFIGGSSKSPLVQSCVIRELTQNDENIDFIIPKDLQAHVSQGAAVHCFNYFGLGIDCVEPITSESVYIITQNDAMSMVIPASSSVPSKTPFRTELVVSNDNQSMIELPICVGNKNKLLGILSIHADEDWEFGGEKTFERGDVVIVKAQINHEKLLLVEATVNEKVATTQILNPLANEELSSKQMQVLKAKQAFNQSLLDNQGRPTKYVVKEYIRALENADEFELAADFYIALERLDKTENHATQICHLYDRAGMKRKSDYWAEIAHKRDPDEVTAFNLYCKENDIKKQIQYLEEALEFDPNYTSALLALGRILQRRGEPKGKKLLRKAQELLQSKIIPSERNLQDLVQVSRALDDEDAEAEAKKELDKMKKEKYDASLPYDVNNLVSSLSGRQLANKP